MYKIDQVAALFECELCLKTIVSPVALPCGSNVCASHLQKYLAQDEFKCRVCEEEHTVPKGGFKINKNMQKSLELELNQVFKSNPLVEECKDHIENATKVIRDLECLKESPDGYIYEYFEEIKRQVDLRRENLKTEIDTFSDKIIDQIEKTKSECIQMNIQIIEIARDIDISNQELDKIKDHFNTLKVNETQINKMKRELTALESKLNEKLIQHQDTVLKNTDYFFEFEKIIIGDIFGEFRKNEKKSTGGESYELIATLKGHSDPVKCVSFSQNNLLASGSSDNTIRIWNTDTWSLVKELKGHYDSVYSVSFNQRNLLASGSNDKTIRIWNTDNWSLVKELKGHTIGVLSLSFNQRNLLASGSWDRSIRIWNTDNWSLVKELKGHSDSVESVSFNQKSLLASGSNDKTIRIWNTDSWSLVKELKGHTASIKCVSFSQQNLLASGSTDMTIRIWNTDAWKLEKELKGHLASIASLCFNQHNILASGSSDNTIRIWNIETWSLVNELRGDKGSVQTVSFNKNNLLASGSWEETIHIWNPK